MFKKGKSGFEGKKHTLMRRLENSARLSGVKRNFKHSSETIEKIKLARAKQVITEETKRKMSIAHKDKKFSKEHLHNIHLAFKKRYKENPETHPNFNKSLSEITRKKIREGNLGTFEERYGKEKAKEVIRKIKEARAGQIVSEETKLKIKEGVNQPEIIKKIKASRLKQIFPLKDSSIEIKVQELLTKLGIAFKKHIILTKDYPYQVDIFIPSKNLVIECDGDYWHGNKFEDFRELTKKQKEVRIYDYLRSAELEYNGFKVIRLQENLINNLNTNKLQEVISYV